MLQSLAGDGLTTRSSVVEAEAVGKRYGRDVWALRDVSLSIVPGAIVGLVGPNAAGKSTLLKTLVGFERPTSGQVRVCGLDPWRDRDAALRHIGYVPQVPALYRDLSVSRHLDLASAMRSGFDRALAERRLDDLGVPKDARAGRLSGGQAAQVSLAIALGTRAEVLLLDEPLASLDPLARREFLDVLVDAVRAQGTTALLSSHVVGDVERACDRIVVLGVGQKLLDAPLADLSRTHRLLPDGDRPDASMGTAIGRVEASDGAWAWLVSVPDGEAVPTEPSPTVEQVVLGYLAAGRHPIAVAA